MLGGEACFNELDPSRNPVLFLDEDYTLKLQSETLHNETLFEILDTASNNGGGGGIEATDVSSLLAQFEEAADTAKDIQKLFHVKTETPAPEIPDPASIKLSHVTDIPDPASIKLSDDVIRKIRALKEKKKSTIMLPMGMPSKRGRGSAIAMHSSSASQKLQKIMASNLNENSIIKLDTYVPRKSSISNVEKSNDVCANYYTPIPEHDYCQNVPKPAKETNVSIDYNEEDILDLQDSETWSDKENDENDSGINESFVSNSCAKKQLNNKRNYRKRDREESPEVESGNYFDKIPSYYTALSRKHCQKKTKSSASDKPLGNSSFEDSLQSNPTPDSDSSAYNKLPAYYSCFTNSTKYDNSKGFDSSQDSRSSGYSSIPSSYRSRSPSPSYERSPSRSRSRARYNSVSRGRRRTRVDRRSSYSSADSRSSSRSSKCSMCSRSRSVSRTRCLSRDSYSSDSSYSRSRSRSPNYRRTSRSISRERRRQKREKEREERKQQQIEERRIIYVGKVPNDYTRKKLHTRFQRFGEIEEVSLHFREHGDNYGFVTFLYTCDAYAAIEKGNTIPGEERFDLCFGGRRQFCETEYADLDGNAEIEEEFNPYPTTSDPFDFDALLKQAKNKMGKR